MPTGEIRNGVPVLGGYYQIEGIAHMSWIEVGVSRNQEGNRVASRLTFWTSGKPTRPLGGSTVSIHKRQ